MFSAIGKTRNNRVTRNPPSAPATSTALPPADDPPEPSLSVPELIAKFQGNSFQSTQKKMDHGLDSPDSPPVLPAPIVKTPKSILKKPKRFPSFSESTGIAESTAKSEPARTSSPKLVLTSQTVQQEKSPDSAKENKAPRNLNLDANYEFNAPKFFDFMTGDNDKNADLWFDNRVGSPGYLDEREARRSSIKLSSAKKLRRISSLPKFEVLDLKDVEESKKKQESSHDEKDDIVKTAFPFKKTAKTFPVRLRSEKMPTIPKEFKFTKTGEQKQRNANAADDILKIKSGGIEKKIKKRAGLTIPKSPKLHKTKTIKEQKLDPKSPFVPRAVKLARFEKDTPERFRTLPKKIEKLIAHTLTQPKSPFLLTKIRPKHYVPTSEELELKELEKHPKFKAQPVDQKVHEGQSLRPPVPIPPTIPHSPAITKPKPRPTSPEPLPEAIVKANPVRSLPLFEPTLDHKYTIPEEIHLPGDSISERKIAEFKAKIEAEEQELVRMREFRARPYETKDESGEHSGGKKKSKKELEEEEKYVFKATPMPNLEEKFVPEKSKKPVTRPEKIVLASEIQAEKRKAFDEAIRKKELEIMVLKEQLEVEKKIHEQEEIKRLRKEMEFRAQPVKQFAPVVVQHSAKPLTECKSPKLGNKRKRVTRTKSLLGMSQINAEA